MFSLRLVAVTTIWSAMDCAYAPLGAAIASAMMDDLAARPSFIIILPVVDAPVYPAFFRAHYFGATPHFRGPDQGQYS